MPEPASGRTKTPAGAISWNRSGSGSPLILINGYGGTAADWDPAFIGGLASTSTVWCLNNRGMGESTGNVDGMSIGDMADDTIAFMDGAGIETAVVAAWSMGGFIAQTVAAKAPDRVESLVLMATDPGGSKATHCNREVGLKLFDHSGTGDEQARRQLGIIFPPDEARRVYEEFGAVIAEARESLPLEVVSAQRRAMKDWYLKPADQRLESITSPVLLATGTVDQVIPAANSELLSRTLPDSWLARFPGGGHAFMEQEPVRVAATIRAFTGR